MIKKIRKVKEKNKKSKKEKLSKESKKFKERPKEKSDKIKFEFLNNALLIDDEILIFGDFHLGLEDHMIRGGILPDIQFRETMRNLNELFRHLFLKVKIIKKIIILGDLKHDFGEVNEAEWRESNKLLDHFINKVGGNNVILIKGNHDNYLIGVAKKKNVKLERFYKYKEVLFMHGHEEYKRPMQKAKYLVLGHLHPAISLQDEYKREKYKCFLRGKWQKKIVYILPSFTNMSYGYDLTNVDYTYPKNKDKFMFIDEKQLKNFEVIIYNNKEKKKHNFGKLKGLINP